MIIFLYDLFSVAAHAPMSITYAAGIPPKKCDFISLTGNTSCYPSWRSQGTPLGKYGFTYGTEMSSSKCGFSPNGVISLNSNTRASCEGINGEENEYFSRYGITDQQIIHIDSQGYDRLELFCVPFNSTGNSSFSLPYYTNEGIIDEIPAQVFFLGQQILIPIDSDACKCIQDTCENKGLFSGSNLNYTLINIYCNLYSGNSNLSESSYL